MVAVLVGVAERVLVGTDVTGDWGEAVVGGAGAAAPAGTEVCGEGVAVRGADGECNDGDSDSDGWSETDRDAATGWLEAVGRGELVAASAVPAAATAIAAEAAIAALTALTCRSFMRRRRGTLCTVVPCTAGGAPDGHSAASRSAASARCDRPRSCQFWP